MKSYLQRLAARAEGVGPTPSLIPTVRNVAIPQSENESDFAEADAIVNSPAESKNRPDAVMAIQPPSPAQSVPPLPSKRAETAARRIWDDSAEEAVIAENLAVNPNVPTGILASPPKPLLPDTKSNERSADRVFTNTSQSVSNLLSPRELNLDKNRIGTSGTTASEDLASAERHSPIAANKEPVMPLEPRLMEAPPVPVPVPDEPRLVIGQMRVDVVTTATSKTREVVRVVTRAEGSNNRSRVAGPISKLRFGLGQM
ncbi:MAG: hypothetical protein H0U18_17355 [Pyrinomonadaceae bacterium]|nr:hypothetical protein [Pyrinomonadaceae bacterium]